MNYPYTLIQLIDGEIKAVVNKEAKPEYDKMFRAYLFDLAIATWKQNHEVFEFANESDMHKVLEYSNLLLDADEDELKKGIEVTCIKIKCEESLTNIAVMEVSCKEDLKTKLNDEAIDLFINNYIKSLPHNWRTTLDMYLAMKNAMLESLSYPNKY